MTNVGRAERPDLHGHCGALLARLQRPERARRALQEGARLWEETEDPSARALLRCVEARMNGQAPPTDPDLTSTGGVAITSTEVTLDKRAFST